MRLEGIISRHTQLLKAVGKYYTQLKRLRVDVFVTNITLLDKPNAVSIA